MATDQEVRQSEVLAINQMNDAIKSLSYRFDKHQDKQDHMAELIGAIRMDIAVMKQQQEGVENLRSSAKEHEARIKVLENRNAQQDGAASFVKWVKEFGPWLFGLAVLAWSMFGLPKR